MYYYPYFKIKVLDEIGSYPFVSHFMEGPDLRPLAVDAFIWTVSRDWPAYSTNFASF